MIRVLPDEVVDRIAAGEVVERPAAVVKELIENALDAGATQVTVHLEAGGRNLIRVADDGEGIPPEQLPLAFFRHATSKLSSVEDLCHIASLGFRGEALASIGAVSRTRISSRCRDVVEGASIENNGGRVSAVRPAGCPAGTTVEVRNLFYNVPARLKFMKTESTELSNCVDAVIRFALAYPGTVFALHHNDRKVLEADPGAGPRERIARFFGKETAEKLIPLEQEVLGIAMKGFLGSPDLGRRDQRRSLLFLNGRHIRDKTVHAAIRKAYQEVMPDKFQPVYFLNLGMPTEWADVNVHPTKTEVRFLDGARIFSSVYKAVSRALTGGERTVSVAEGVAEPRPVFFKKPAPGDFQEPLPLRAPDLFEDASPLPRRRRIVQIRETYAVFQSGEGLAIVDIHALHERVLYEKLRQEYAAGGVRLQKLLLPLSVELDAANAARIDGIAFDLNHLGIRAESFGPRTLRITAVPALLKKADPSDLVREAVDNLEEGHRGEDAYRALLHRMACRAAVKAGDTLSEEEIQSLLDSAEKIDFSGRCPHGRPTTVVFSVKDLETLFKRRGF